MYACDYSSSSDKIAEITTVPISSNKSPETASTVARMQFTIDFVVLCVKGFMCSNNGFVLNETPCRTHSMHCCPSILKHSISLICCRTTQTGFQIAYHKKMNLIRFFFKAGKIFHICLLCH